MALRAWFMKYRFLILYRDLRSLLFSLVLLFLCIPPHLGDYQNAGFTLFPLRRQSRHAALATLYPRTMGAPEGLGVSEYRASAIRVSSLGSARLRSAAELGTKV